MKWIFLRGGIALSVVVMNLAACTPVPVEKSRQAESHYIMGVSALQERNPTMALKDFLKAESFDPKRADIQNGLGQAYQLKKSYALAERHYLNAVELQPEDPRFSNNLGALYLDMGEWDKAIASFQKAAGSLFFNSPEVALTGIGVAWFHKGDRDQALSYYRRALEEKRTYPNAYYYMGELYRNKGDYSRAKENYRRAVELAPNYAMAHHSLGLVLLEEGAFAEARTAFQKVVALAPDSEIGEEARRLLITIP
ncbi:MAG: tetratricopeptide repeat protein [Deltaproteobacteria bacterium]|nr:tetratricopeptide repeat protein [Deltaproteobacteria bacterium]